MNDIQCNKSSCFYWAKGLCSSITAVDAIGCAQFRAKEQIYKITPPRRVDLTQIRKHLEEAFNASKSATQLHPQTRPMPCASAHNDLNADIRLLAS
ncbi:hypothetical protein [Magnetovibrio sp.]|uniref:hypothetical protein n=1 Tax=Magnetovibrio sp. TaxID=2024836 RepID=UPI002F94AF22